VKILKRIFIANLTVILFILLFTGLAGCSGQPETDNTANNLNSVDSTKLPGITVNAEFIEPEENDIADSAIPLKNIENDINAGENNAKKDGFAFIYNSVTVYLDDYIENVLKGLGDANDYDEADSCTFDGIMSTYFYNGFEIATYVIKEADRPRIYSITFNDDSVSTAEGIYIGHAVEEMISAYGTEYEETTGFNYRYKKYGTQLSFYVEDDIIRSITYQLSNINDC